MKLNPYKDVKGVPNGRGNFVDVNCMFEFIDIADLFILQTVRGIRKDYYVGVSAYAFQANLAFAFDQSYKLTAVEFREPYELPDRTELYYSDINLFQPTLLDVKNLLDTNGIATELIDVGLKAKELGVSFFSSDYGEDLSVRLDAVSVHFYE